MSPPVTGPLHEFVPPYEAVMAVAVARPSPDTETVQLAYGASKPPAEMAIVNRIVDPCSVPVSVPRPVIDVPVTVIVTVPDRSPPDCVTCSVIDPGPEESEAIPRH